VGCKHQLQNLHLEVRSVIAGASAPSRKPPFLTAGGETELPPMGIDDRSLEHMSNWFECMRSRQQPHATVDNGFAHSVACIMSTEAYWSGEKQYWDAKNETIIHRLPVA
jgi:hypothetical protein